MRQQRLISKSVVALIFIQADFHHFQQIKHGDVMQPVGSARNRQLNTSHHRIIARILQRHATVKERGNHHFVIENLWNAGTEANGLGGLEQERRINQRVSAHAEIRLRQLHALVGIQAEKREHVYRAASAFRQSAQQRGVTRRETGKIARATGGTQQHDIVAFHPQRLEQLFQERRIVALSERSLIKRQHVLVEAPERQRTGVGLVLQNNVHVPEQLTCLPERLWFVLRVMPRIGGNGEQFLTTTSVRAALRLLFRQYGITQDVALRCLK